MSRYDYKRKSIGSQYYGQRQSKKKSRLARVFFFLIFFALIVALFIYVFPEVEVTLIPQTETIKNEFEVTVSADFEKADLARNKIPGELIMVNDSLEKSFETSGEKNIGDKASGEIVFYNQTGLSQPLSPENSLVSDDGIVFILNESITIPKAEVSAEGAVVYGTLTATIVSKEAGEDGNINPGRLTIIDLPFSKQNKIYGEVKTKLTGGNSEVIKVVSQQDLDNAEKQLQSELEPIMELKIKNRIEDNLMLDNDMINFEVVEVTKAVELEEEIEQFTVKMDAKAEALVWDKDIVKDIIRRKIQASVSEDKSIVETSRDVFEIEVIDFDLNAKTASLNIYAENQVSMPIDINSIKDQLKGQTEFSARRILLEKENIKDVRFKFNYSITNKIPQNGNRINVNISL